MKKISTLIIGSLLISACYALHEDRPPGAKFQLEQTQETVAQQQAYQGRMDASGAIPTREGESRVPKTGSSKAAASTLSNVARKQAATKNLQVADQRVGDKPSESGKPWWFAIVLLAFGLIGFLGVKDWVRKNVPDMPVQKKRKRGAGEA